MVEKIESTYKKLAAISRKTTVLSATQQLLEWDQETYMPEKGIALRSEQIEMLADLTHKQSTSKQFKKLLSSLIDLEHGNYSSTNLTQEKLANLREWRRDYLHNAKLPASFVRTFARATSQSQHAWGEAKRTNSFKLFLPHLEKIVSLNRKKADFLGYQEHPYDALLDLYEPEMTIRDLLPLFDKLKVSLLQLLREILAKPIRNRDFLHRFFPPQQQMAFAHLLLKGMGFTPETSRLDLTMHPFCLPLSPLDVRLTTHVHNEDPMSNFFAVLHEGGHGLYGQGLPIEYYGTPLCQSVSYGVDESQSRFWETIIGHSLAFWRFYFPLLQKEFSEQLGAIELDAFYRAINIVRPSLIRIHSDEVTYSLHIIIRFEIEKMLIEGTLKAKEIPEIWNEKMREYLGIEPPTNAEGCLQDVHWSMGAIGYFPTYTLGNLYAAQLFEVFQKSYPNWEEKVAHGDLSFIREWLRKNIHCHGRLYPPKTLMHKATGHDLSEQPYIRYLESKFRTLYSIGEGV
jgi:carboxypeptidase Taq